MTAAASVWDDKSIPSDETLYRRVPQHPDFLVRDLLSGQEKISRAAFKWDPDGISVYRHLLMQRWGIDLKMLLRTESQRLYSFKVAAVRREGAGVTDEVDPEDMQAGKAHALIQGPTGRPSRDRRREITDALAAVAERVL